MNMAKHGFFGHVIRHIHSFQNILLSLSIRHQLLVAYNRHDHSVMKPVLQGTQLSTADVTGLREDIQEALQTKCPCETRIQIAINLCNMVAQRMNWNDFG